MLAVSSKEDLHRKVNTWKESLTRKGLKVNEGKTKNMIGGSSVGLLSESSASMRSVWNRSRSQLYPVYGVQEVGTSQM